jgi:hypothetical protein
MSGSQGGNSSVAALRSAYEKASEFKELLRRRTAKDAETDWTLPQTFADIHELAINGLPGLFARVGFSEKGAEVLRFDSVTLWLESAVVKHLLFMPLPALLGDEAADRDIFILFERLGRSFSEPIATEAKNLAREWMAIENRLDRSSPEDIKAALPRFALIVMKSLDSSPELEAARRKVME